MELVEEGMYLEYMKSQATSKEENVVFTLEALDGLVKVIVNWFKCPEH